MIRKLSMEGAYYIENNGHGVVRYDEGVIDLLHVENKHIKLARLLEKHTLPIVLDFLFNFVEDFEDYTFEDIKLSSIDKRDIIKKIFFNYLNIGDEIL